MLSRGAGGGNRPYGERAGRKTSIRFTSDISAIYDTGFIPYKVDANGDLIRGGALYGIEAAFGVFGVKKSRFGSVGLDYRGTFRRYQRNQDFAGSDNFLGLEIKQQPTRRLSYEGHVTAGTSNRVFSFGNLLVGANLSNVLPVNEVFDNRVYFLQGGASMTYNFNARSSVTIGADAFGIRRNASGLIGVNGYMPRLGYGYRLTRRVQVGVVYGFQHFDYPRAFGESDVHSLAAVISYDLSRRWNVELSGGGFRSDTAGTRTVFADPVLQRLLGLTTVVESFASGFTRPTYMASLRGNLQKSSLVVSFNQSPGGGNGLTLLSEARNFMANYSYTPNRRFSVGVTSSVNRITSLGNNVGGSFNSQFVAGSANYFLTRTLGLTGQAYYRHLDVPFRNALTDAYRVGFGVVWSPGDFGFPVF